MVDPPVVIGEEIIRVERDGLVTAGDGAIILALVEAGPAMIKVVADALDAADDRIRN